MVASVAVVVGALLPAFAFLTQTSATSVSPCTLSPEAQWDASNRYHGNSDVQIS